METMTIVSDEGILGGEPRIVGSRVGVRHIGACVIDSGQSPGYVADQLDIALAEVYEALAYYDANLEEIRQFERENEDAFEHVRKSGLKPKEPIE